MQLNTQPPEKRVLGSGDTLLVNSVFATIQGEGPFAGTPAVFVRLAGCNLQCPLCDTEYSSRVECTVDDLVNKVHEAAARFVCLDLVVITGGEPFRQPLGKFATALSRLGIRVQIETNGTLYQPAFPYPDRNVTIVCSPKTGAVHRNVVPWVAAWKYVATADNIQSDGLPSHALEHPASDRLYRPPMNHPAPVYLQPVDEQDADRNAANTRAVAQACMVYGFRLCIQLHKIAGLE